MPKKKAVAVSLLMLTIIIPALVLDIPLFPYVVAGVVGGWLIERRLHILLVSIGIGFFIFLVGLVLTAAAPSTAVALIRVGLFVVNVIAMGVGAGIAVILTAEETQRTKYETAW